MSSAQAQKLEILEAGTYIVDKGNCARDDRGILMCDRLALRLDQRTDAVPAALEVEFGVRYRVTDLPTRDPISIRRVWRLPAPGFHPPGKPPVHRMERIDRTPADRPIHATYGFDDEWELITGEWVLEFWHGETKLGEQRFVVIRPMS